MLLVLQVPNVYSSESNANEELYEFLSSESLANSKLFDFLSNVVGLDLTKYAIVPPSVVPPGFEDLSPLEFYEKLSDYVPTLPPTNFTLDDPFAGLVEQECPSYDFEYNENKIHVMSIFYNRHMNFFKISDYDQDFVYSELQPTDILNRALGILQRYQTFFTKNYGTEAQYLVPMLDILDAVDELSPTEFTEGNITFQVTKDEDKTHIKWIYTEDDVLMNWKRVDMEFHKNTFESFHDTWSLYNVSGLSEISSEEAFQLAFEAAQNYEFRLLDENGEIELRKVPDLSYAFHQDYFSMVPFRYDEYNFPSRVERDPLTLYPFWQFYFYFNETVSGNDGMQVGIWGDTSELVYCSGFGYYGTSEPPNEQTIPEFPSLNLLFVGIFAITGLSIIHKRYLGRRGKNE